MESTPWQTVTLSLFRFDSPLSAAFGCWWQMGLRGWFCRVCRSFGILEAVLVPAQAKGFHAAPPIEVLRAISVQLGEDKGG